MFMMQNGPWMHGYGHDAEWALDAWLWSRCRMGLGCIAMVTMQNGPWMHGYDHDAEWALDAWLWSRCRMGLGCMAMVTVKNGRFIRLAEKSLDHKRVASKAFDVRTGDQQQTPENSSAKTD